MKPTELIPKVITFKSLFIQTSVFLFFTLFLSSCNNSQDPFVSANESSAAVAYSTDNGDTWKIQYVSGDASLHYMYSISSMDFGSTLTSLTDYSVYRSQDTALSWSLISQATFNKKLTGTGILNSGVMVNNNGIIEYTSDNGKTFSELTSGTTRDLKDIVIDSQSGYGYISGDDVVLKTTDHGQTWVKTSGYDSLKGEYNLYSISMIDSNIVYIKGYQIFSSGAKLIKSLDGFKSVSVLELPYNNYYIPPGISFIDENIGVTTIGLNDGSISRTSDGGQTWTKINISSERDINAVKFVDGICFATSNSKIHRSADLGLTWTIEQFSGSYIFSDIYSPSPGKIFMCGKYEITNK